MADDTPITKFTSLCAAHGFDLCADGRVADYNRAVGADLALPDLGRPDAAVVLVGNSRALWPHFTAALAADPSLLHGKNPLDDWVVATLSPLAASLGAAFDLRFSHEPPPRLVAMQRLAEVVGLASRGPGGLSAHPIFGPWISLRAALVLDYPGRPATPAANPCAECSAPCEAALDAVLAGSDGGRVRDDWRQWLTIRDACPVGDEERFSDRQIRYHYVKDTDILRT